MNSDIQIQKDVMDELRWEPMLDAAEIGVAVCNGVVTLSGNVDSYLKKVTAEKAVKRLKNVRAVALDLDVRPGPDDERNDSEIAVTALEAMKWNSAVPQDAIRITVENGWVTLEGEVNWQYQKAAACDAMQVLTGIQGIINMIKVTPAANTGSIKENIRKALQRNADVEASGIHIEATGNQVILKGAVHSWNERLIVEHAAWASPGVAIVKDELTISD